MKTSKLLLIISILAIAGGAYFFLTNDQDKMTEKDSSSHEAHDHSEHDHNMISSGNKMAMGSGIIHKVDVSNKKINLTHDPIPELKWPKMTMDLEVADNVDLGNIPLNQAIKFHIQLGQDKIYRVTEIISEDSHNHSTHQH